MNFQLNKDPGGPQLVLKEKGNLTPMRRSNLAVVESRWWEGYNSSIRGVFDLISDIHYDHYHGYVYEMVSTTDALREAITRLVRHEKIDVLYIASHGSRSRLKLMGGSKKTVSGEQLEQILHNLANHKTGITGLYLGICEFGTQKLAKQLLGKIPRLQWMAGYSAEIDFVESSALDMLFFNDWLNRRGSSRQKNGRVAQYMSKSVGDLCRNRKIRFSIYAKGDNDDVVDLLNYK